MVRRIRGMVRRILWDGEADPAVVRGPAGECGWELRDPLHASSWLLSRMRQSRNVHALVVMGGFSISVSMLFSFNIKEPTQCAQAPPQTHQPISPSAHPPISQSAHQPISPSAHQPISSSAHQPIKEPKPAVHAAACQLCVPNHIPQPHPPIPQSHPHIPQSHPHSADGHAYARSSAAGISYTILFMIKACAVCRRDFEPSFVNPIRRLCLNPIRRLCFRVLGSPSPFHRW